MIRGSLKGKSQSGALMSRSQETRYGWRRLTVLAIAVFMLGGCAANAPKKEVEAAPRTVVVAPEVRADFDAAMVHIKAEEYQKGIDLLNEVVAKSPKIAVPYINLAMAYEKLGDHKQAEDNFKHALELEPDNPVANNEYALLYRRTGRFNDARQIYEKLVAKYPHFSLPHKNLGILCDIYLRDYACALREYEAYGKEAPDDKNVEIWIADVQRRVTK
jgi:Tfp pilus assembly protein PilF